MAKASKLSTSNENIVLKEVMKIHDEIRDVKQDIVGVKQDVGTLKQDVKSLKHAFVALDAKIEKTKIAIINEIATSLAQSVLPVQDDHEKRIGKIEKHLALAA